MCFLARLIKTQDSYNIECHVSEFSSRHCFFFSYSNVPSFVIQSDTVNTDALEEQNIRSYVESHSFA